MSQALEAVLFDFDYTLADSSRAVVECAGFALEGMGLPSAPPEAICRTIGLSLPETLVRLAGEEHRSRSEEFRKWWRQRSDQIMVEWTEVLPGVCETVRPLREGGLRLGIVSTKFRSRIDAVLQREDLSEVFEVVVGGEDVSQHKPDPEGLLRAVEMLGASQESAVYVGDSVTDAETAARAGIRFVAVLSGATRPEEFHGYPLMALLPDVSGLAGVVR